MFVFIITSQTGVPLAKIIDDENCQTSVFPGNK